MATSKDNENFDDVDNIENEEQDLQYDEETNGTDLEGNVIKNIDRVLHDSMIPYSEFVILDRALPRVEDGLKPVQRRILYTMYSLGYTPDKPFKKSASIVGDVMGKYHPHGDTSIYDAMARLGQDFNMRETLVEGHGNYGSVDGDPPAAMRYTEARLSPLALEMLKDIEKDTVRWSKNYDDTRDEPDMLPSKFPNILVNGANGIAVGLATNIPTHNLAETIDGCIAVIDDEKISLEKLMQIIKGPDFPTGALILGTDGIKQAYETGKGKLILRAKTNIEKDKDKENIVVTEFPYQVNKANLLHNISLLKDKHKDLLSGINDIRDESDRSGIRAVVSLKKGADSEAILNYLFKNTDLQQSYNVNMVVIANGKPVQMGLKDILTSYVNYQREVLINRSKYDLESSKQRAHILEGLLVAINNIDEVVRIIKKSSGTAEAKEKLMKRFDLSEKQVQAILDMRLARLTNLEVTSIEAELAELNATIKKLTEILASKKMQMQIIKQEMTEIKKNFGNARRTQIVTDEKKIELKDVELKPITDVFICYSAKNCLKKISERSFNISSRSISKTSTLNEVHSLILKTKSDTELFLFSNFGNCYRLNQDLILDARWKDRGSMLKDLILGYSSNEKIVGMFAYKTLPKKDLVFVTKNGLISRSAWTEFDVKKLAFNSTKLKENDEVVNVFEYEKDKTVLFVSEQGMALNANVDDLTLTSRMSYGVKGINLNDGDNCLFASSVNDDSIVAICTDLGFAKEVAVKDIGILGRNRKGIKLVSLNKETGKKLLFADLVTSSYELFALDEKNSVVSVKTDELSVESRVAKGLNISKNKKGKQLKCVYKYLWK